jgi:hypothetical protein
MSGTGAGLDLSDGWDLSGLSLAELWLGYVALGGTASQAQLAAYARGLGCPDSYQHNLIAQAINEHFIDRGEDHLVSYQNIPSLPQQQHPAGGRPWRRAAPVYQDDELVIVRDHDAG